MGTSSTSAAVWTMLAERWRKSIKAKGLTSLTEDRYLATAHRWVRWLDAEGLDLEPADVRPHHIDDFTVDIITTTSESNAAHHYRNLRVFFGFLVKRKEIAAGSPFDQTEPPRQREKITDLLTDENHASVLLTCDGKDLQSLRDRAIILLFIDTGMRVSELHSLEKDSINLTTKQLVIMGKGQKPRIVRFGNSTGLAFARYLKARSLHVLADSPALWLSRRKDKPLSIHGIQVMLNRRGKLADIPGSLYPHRFRHDFSDRWQANGGSEAGLMEIAGWASHKMPRHYGKAAKTRRALAEHERISPADSLVA
ncbi:tyrosine-type recombinase/integrase [Actinokineospora sp. G85]|uniref:tyrosine-type recombinase/integrase n=1 Tax=Actinokineospora sp. G85 TaxID=3406626 RepID=UPI003C759346